MAERGHRIGQWLDARQQQLLPTDHFHVIFTLPSELHALWRWNRHAMTEVLFRAVRETLLTLLADPRWLGAQPGVLAALHTWGRTLTLHPHVHCLVSGGRLDPAGQWRPIRTGFLLPVAVVRTLFRGKILGAIEALETAGYLALPPSLTANGLRRLLRAAARRKWNVRIAERYPHGRGVVKYLAAYVRGGPIKDHRFVAFADDRVTFRYGNHRRLDPDGTPHQQDLTLSVEEFLGRWSEHVALPGVHTVRAWGLYAARQRGALARCRAQLAGPSSLSAPPARPHLPDLPPHREQRCPVCRRPLLLTQMLPRGGLSPPATTWPRPPGGSDQIPIAGRLHVQLALEAANGPAPPPHARPPGWPVAA